MPYFFMLKNYPNSKEWLGLDPRNLKSILPSRY